MPRSLAAALGVAAAVVPGTAEEEVAVARSLSLEGCIMQAIRENPDLRTESLNILVGREQIERELAEFGWKLEAGARITDRDKPQNAQEAAVTGTSIFSEDTVRYRAGLTKRLTNGATFEFGTTYANNEDDLTRSSFRSTFSPEHEVFFGVTLTQPLMRGVGTKNNLAPIELARLREQSARMLTMVKAMNLVAEVAARYTDVVAADEAIGVQQQNIRHAEALVERNKKLVDSGKGVERDVTTAELAVYQRQDQLLQTTAEKMERLNALFALINRGPDFERGTHVVPVTGFGLHGMLPPREVLADSALRRRVDVAYYRSVIEAARINVRRAKDQGRPELNVVGSVGSYGLEGDFGSAYDRAFNGQGEEVAIGVEFKMDLGKDPGEPAVRAAEYQLRQAELGYGKALNTIRLEVDTAYSRVMMARQRVVSAAKAQELAAENLAAEQKLLDEGKGDLYRVIERQQILGDAMTNVVLTRALLSKSLVALWMSSGELFERYGINEEWINATVSNAPPQQ